MLDSAVLSSVYSVYTEMTDTTVLTANLKEDPASLSAVRPLRMVIPGGQGHLGRILARYFSERGYYVTTLSRTMGEASPHESDENARLGGRSDGTANR